MGSHKPMKHQEEYPTKTTRENMPQTITKQLATPKETQQIATQVIMHAKSKAW